MAVDVTLTLFEVEFAALVGVRRHVEKYRNSRKDRHKFDGDAWKIDINGACGELAYAKHSGRYWSSLGLTHRDLHAGDVGLVEVRHTVYKYGCLPLHEDDKDDRPYVLATGEPPVIRLVGGIIARDGKRAEYWRTEGLRSPCFMVPQEALRAIT